MRLKEDDEACLEAMRSGSLLLYHTLAPLLQKSPSGLFQLPAINTSGTHTHTHIVAQRLSHTHTHTHTDTHTYTGHCCSTTPWPLCCRSPPAASSSCRPSTPVVQCLCLFNSSAQRHTHTHTYRHTLEYTHSHTHTHIHTNTHTHTLAPA